MLRNMPRQRCRNRVQGRNLGAEPRVSCRQRLPPTVRFVLCAYLQRSNPIQAETLVEKIPFNSDSQTRCNRLLLNKSPPTPYFFGGRQVKRAR